MAVLDLNYLATIIVLGLVAWRVARIVPLDSIAESLREKIALWTYPETVGKSQGRREFVGTLLSCTVCLSFWVSGAAVLFYELVVVDEFAGWMFVIEWLAVAGAAAVLSLTADS